MSARERTCRACEGTGDVGGTAFDRYLLNQDCLVCLGSGRIEERIPASDAIADAETLFKVMAHWYSRKGWTHTQTYRARANGWVVGSCGSSPVAQTYAIAAARAAFRAVPGLRS